LKGDIYTITDGNGYSWRILVFADRRPCPCKISPPVWKPRYTTERGARAAARRVAKQLNLEVEE